MCKVMLLAHRLIRTLGYLSTKGANMSYTKLTHAQLKSVPLPDNKFNLSLLLPETRTIDCVPGFETVEWCANEDHRRAAAIRALSVREVRRWLFYSQEPREVADALGQAQS